MRAEPTWVDKVHDGDKEEQSIYSLCFNPDGSQLVVAAGQRVLVYDTTDGSLIQPLIGHKDNIYCVAYSKDGKRFASGGADKSVIIWTSKLEGFIKYSHNDAVQCLAFNPVSHQLASCAITDFAFWSAEKKNVQKFKSPARINTCAWTNDGQYLALGLISGIVSLRNKQGDEKGKIELPGGSSIWALAWNPVNEDNYDILCVTDWNQTLSLYTITGKLIGKERQLGFDPLCVSFFSKGEYLLVSGSNKGAVLMTREGIRLGTVGEDQQSWVWCCAARPDSAFVAIGCQDGTIAYYQLIFNTIHGLYRERYAYRENMTDVIIQHLLNDQKVRIKCRDLIKKIAVYKNRLAVQLPERVVIYEQYSPEANGMHYKVKEKINQRLECNLLVVCAEHLVLCQERRLQSLTFDGVKQREWLMESVIRYMKVLGGPSGREGLLLGLKSGLVVKVYLDNAFPVQVHRVDTPIRCLDLSASKRKLAIVDEKNRLLVFELKDKKLLFEEVNANSVSWNTNFEDMLCFSGNNILSIKANDFPVHQQKLLGFVVGVTGSKVFCLHISSMTTIDVPLSAPMYQYVERNMFKDAFNVACLGVTDGDWKQLAHAALDGLDFQIAKQAFQRIKDLKYLELISEFEGRQKKNENDEVFKADILAFRGKFKEAAKLFQKFGQEQKAITMFTDLRMFDYAQEYLGSMTTEDRKALIRKKADWAKNINEPRAAAEMYLSAGETLRAVELIGQHGWVDMLLDVGRRADRHSEAEALGHVARHLQRLGHIHHATEMFRKLGDEKSVVLAYVEARDWTEAFSLAEQRLEFREVVYVPYAHWLAENDKFIEAQRAFHKAGRLDQAANVLNQLTANAINEARYQDASWYFWILAKQCLDIVTEKNDIESELLKKYHEYERKACIYYAYDVIHKYLDEPFTSYMSDALFNISRYLLNESKDLELKGVSKFSILYTLSKQAKTLGAFKLARQVLDKIQTLRVPQNLQDQVDYMTMMIKGKQYSDSEELQPMCYRCSSYNPLLINGGNHCQNCREPFILSFVTFDILPLVEFQLEEGISDEEAVRLIELTGPGQENENGWRQNTEENYQTMHFEDQSNDPFLANLVDFEAQGDQFVPFIVNRATLQKLDPSGVIVHRWPRPLKYQFYRNLMPEMQITVCQFCFKAFYTDDFELKVIDLGYCPFCRNTPANFKSPEKSEDT